MMLYLLEQKISKPDCVIPLPGSWFSRADPAHSMAAVIASIWGVPALPALNLQLKLKKGILIEDKIVLLVGERICPRFFEAAQGLIAGHPRAILGTALFGTH